MNTKYVGETFGVTLSAVGTATQTDPLLQNISLILTIVGAVIAIVSSLINIYQKVKKNDKITSEDIKQVLDTTDKQIKDIKDALPKKENKDGQNQNP